MNQGRKYRIPQDKRGLRKVTDSLAGTVRAQLVPLLASLCRILERDEEPAAWVFFHQIMTGLEAAEEEAEIGNFVIELSASAFLGFRYSPDAALVLDHLLERAIEIADTMSADQGQAH